MNISWRTIWNIVIAASLGVILFSAVAYGGKKKMEPLYLYDIQEAKSLEPQVYNVKTSSSVSLFPVPQDNSIGTNDMNNAITIFSFPKGKLDYQRYFKNAFDQVGGGGEFIPVISPDMIGFGQTRRFVIYNFKTKKYASYRVAASIEESIEKIAISSAWQKYFIFEIKGYNRKSQDHRDYTNSLQLMDLSGEQPQMIKKVDIGKVTIWAVADGKIFLYDLKTKKIRVLDMKLEPANHPLADAIQLHKGKIDFTRIQAHPSLPFAILHGGYYGSTFINWGAGRELTPHLLFSEATPFSFSSDGKWVTFKQYIDSNTERTYLMPVSEKYPHYLGSPILLTDESFNENNFGWTNNPVSFVGSISEKIYRWDLVNQPHPESKNMSFHDYIVQEDMKKLTREKKQGLGK